MEYLFSTSEDQVPFLSVPTELLAQFDFYKMIAAFSVLLERT